MTNQLTRTIMQNIVEKCTSSKGNGPGGNKMHIGNKEENMIRNIIHKGTSQNRKPEANRRIEVSRNAESKTSTKHVTLDELISKSVGDNKVEDNSVTEKIKEPYRKGINKVSLEDIVPKVSLTSIGKKR
ncbi:hypothetical protein R9X47_19695 [Wukongibacter baidiensis]|uniref:hypothetical protein n=1 Tax=Wukongibacter baidiensis TaxID=1723361 RepID=UPI003D7FBEF9